MVKLVIIRRATENGVHTFSDRMFLFLANASSVCLRTWTGTQRTPWSMCPSRSRCRRSSRAAVRGTSDDLCAIFVVRRKKVPTGPPNNSKRT